MFASLHGHDDISDTLLAYGAKDDSDIGTEKEKVMYAALVCDRE